MWKVFSLFLLPVAAFAASQPEWIWSNAQFRIVPVYRECSVRKLPDCKSGIEAVYRSSESRPGVIAQLPTASIAPVAPENIDLARYAELRAEVENLSDRPVLLVVRIHSERGRDRHSAEQLDVILQPQEKRSISVPYTTIASHNKIRLEKVMRGPAGADCNPNLHPRGLRQVDFLTYNPALFGDREYHLRITDIRFAGTPPVYASVLAEPERFYPFIDRFGQYIHGDWPGKVREEAEIARRGEAERAALRALPPLRERNRFGGWTAGPVRRATGFFRVEKVDGRWSLIDPEGRLFFAFSMNSIRYNNTYYQKNRRNWFTHTDSYVLRNLQAKYGQEIFPAALDMTLDRLSAWGFNTLGGWADPRLCRRGRLAYMPVLLDNLRIARIPGIKFYDAFDPAFAAALDEAFRTEWAFSVNDPYCIGYFVQNELSFQPADIGRQLAIAPPQQPGKREFRRLLERKYSSIDALNRAWKSDFRTFDDFMAARKVRFDLRSALPDLRAVTDLMVEQYYKVCRDGVRRNAPNHLYLGSRFMPILSADCRIAGIAARYCDVISINSYLLRYGDLALPGLTIDRPLFLSEFSLRADGNGFFGRQQVRNQKERAAGLERLFGEILSNPRLVGAAWYCYQDQTVTGRDSKGECYPFGFVDITDTPYEEMTAASRKLSETMYASRYGNAKENRR